MAQPDERGQGEKRDLPKVSDQVPPLPGYHPGPPGLEPPAGGKDKTAGTSSAPST